MNYQIKLYYQPTNSKITKGTIYNFYKNNISNLDLSSLISKKERVITIKETEYNKLLNLMIEYHNLIVERNKLLLSEENKIINKLITIDNKKQKILKGDK